MNVTGVMHELRAFIYRKGYIWPGDCKVLQRPYCASVKVWISER
jgi:hypothetical protein